MQEVSPFNFGLIAAYLVPGFVALWGAAYPFPCLRTWLIAPPENLPTVGGLLYVTIASLAAGTTASAVRWLVFDTFHHHTGVEPPRWDFGLLPERLDAYQTLIEIHYRYYQLHANLLVALVFAYVARFTATPWRAYHPGAVDLGFVVVCAVLFLGSRDALRKYYHRAGELLHRSVNPEAAITQVSRRAQTNRHLLASSANQSGDNRTDRA